MSLTSRVVSRWDPDDAAQRPIEQARDELEWRATATLTDAERRHLHSALAKIITVLTAEIDEGSAAATPRAE